MAGKTHFLATAGSGYANAYPLGLYYPFAPTGNVFFVNSAIGSDTAGYGHSPEAPFDSLAYAFSSDRLTANNDDYVFVAPGHTETISGAAGIVADIAGVTVVGLGNGHKRPTITFDTDTAADLDVDAAEITFKNLRFVANVLDVAAAIDVNAAGATFENCVFEDTSTILNAKIWIFGATSTTSNRLTVRNCRFHAYGTANTSAVSLPGTSDRCEISGSAFFGDWGTAAILAAGVVTDILIVNNLVRNLDAGDDVCINLAANSTGIVAYNGVGGAETDNSTDQINCGALCTLIQNYAVDIGDRQGVLDPVAT